MNKLIVSIACAFVLGLSVAVPGAHASFQCGDMNASGSIDSIDGLLVLQIGAGLITEGDVLGEIEAGRVRLAADVNMDDALTSVDALLILQRSAELVETLTCGAG